MIARGGDSRSEAGAASLELALVLPLFLLLLYGSVHYGLLFCVALGMTSGVNEGARAAIAVDPEEADYEALVSQRARAAVMARLAWLTAEQLDLVIGPAGDRISVVVETDATLGPVVRVGIDYPSYPDQPLLPVFVLPILGSIPPVPSSMSARAVTQL